MKTFFDAPLPEIPTPEGSDTKEVYAFFGLCSYYAQVIERGLINLAVVLHTKGYTKITREEIEEAFQEKGRNTLGRLINDIRKQINIETGVEEKLITVLEKRNYLIHEFFFYHDIDFMNEEGRIKMINELSDLTRLFQETDKEMDKITHPLWMKIGLTREMIEKSLEEKYSESNV